MHSEQKRIIKADIARIIDRIANLFKISITPGIIAGDVVKFYDEGLDKAGLQFEMNFTRDPERLGLLNDYVTKNIKNLSDDTMESLRKEITQGVVNLESVSKVSERIKKVLDVTSERAKVIARTELNRAENIGHIDGARQSELKLLKRWDAHLDSRTSAICRALDGQTIPLDAKFKYDGKEFDAPPSHPQCRSTLIFVQKDTV